MDNLAKLSKENTQVVEKKLANLIQIKTINNGKIDEISGNIYFKEEYGYTKKLIDWTNNVGSTVDLLSSIGYMITNESLVTQ